jgi:hypothetical protein
MQSSSTRLVTNATRTVGPTSLSTKQSLWLYSGFIISSFLESLSDKMAPDLNSVPPSPRPLVSSSPRLSSRTTSRRASQQMAPPPLHPSSPSLNILPSNQSAVNHTSPPLASPTVATVRSPLTGFIKPPCLEKNHLSFPKYLILKLLNPLFN